MEQNVVEFNSEIAQHQNNFLKFFEHKLTYQVT